MEHKGPVFGKRHVQILLMFWLLAIAFGMRVELFVAIVAMTDKTTSPNPDVPVFDWTDTGVLLSCFYWGYIWLQVLAGNLGRMYGTKYFLICAMIINSTLNCLLPLMATKWGSYGLMVCRILQGLSQGFFYSSVNNVMSQWSPLSERATLGTLAYSGAHFGTIVTTIVVAMISTTWYGWPLAFYLYGGLGYLWVIIFFFLGASRPSTHSTISKEEREYIERDLDTEDTKADIPWKKIASNIPFYAVFLSQVGQFWVNLTLLTETPTYINKVLKFDMSSNGLISSSPYIASFLLSLTFGYIGDYITNHNILSLIWTRKLFTAIGCYLPGVALIVWGYLPDDAVTLAIVMLITTVGVNTAAGAGSMINHIDLSPNFAGVLLGIINSSGTFVSIFGPITVQLIVTDQTNKDQWRIIFIVASIMLFIPTTIFMFLASAEVQPFDTSEDVSKKKQERMKKHSVISVMSI